MKNIMMVMVMVLVSGCSIPVECVIEHSSEININNYENIYVEVTGNIGDKYAVRLKEQIIKAGMKIVDSKAKGDVYIVGDYNGDYKEQNVHEYVSGSQYTSGYTRYTRTGVYNTIGKIDVIDASSTQIIQSKVLQSISNDEQRGINREAEYINSANLMANCMDRDTDIFMKMICPWKEVVYLKFKKNSNIPKLEEGIKYVKLGKPEAAKNIFINAIQESLNNSKIEDKDVAIAYWDLALINKYMSNYDAAINALNLAFMKYDDEDFIKEKKILENLKKERKE